MDTPLSKIDLSSLSQVPHVFKGRSVNSKRILSIISHADSLDHSPKNYKTRRRHCRKKLRQDAISLGQPVLCPLVERWDGKRQIFMDGAGRGLPSHNKDNVVVLGANSASIVVDKECGALLDSVFCLLPTIEEHNSPRNS
jgi:hypothetical protein